jgi:hypothetical protein
MKFVGEMKETLKRIVWADAKPEANRPFGEMRF